MSTKQIEALKLALEALNRNDYLGWQTNIHVREAIREALADSALERMAENERELELDYMEPAQQPYAQTAAYIKSTTNGRMHVDPVTGDVSIGKKQPAQQHEPHVPVKDNTYGYAKSLAEAIFKQHFASDEHYSSGRIVWGVNDTVIGILTQIDNMVADMVRRPAQRKPLTDEQTWKFKLQLEKDAEMKIPEKPFRHVVRAIEAAHGIKGDA